MAPLLENIAAGKGALGRSGVDVRAFVDGVLGGDLARRRGVFAPTMERHTLNDYIEAQVHGVVSLATDVESLVIDPAFAGTPTAGLLLAMAKRYGFEAEWHPGSALALTEVPQEAPDADEGRADALAGALRRRPRPPTRGARHRAPRHSAAS